jgi:EAL domain-containing protein (putative c-di-GMP-specific phosphodiesterase class I)
MAVTTEGEEREVRRSFLHKAGCNEVQGFLFWKAVSEEQLSRMLSYSHQGRPIIIQKAYIS